MQFRERLAQGLREPLVHFLLVGLAIFLLFETFGREVDVGDRRISVNEEQVKRLAQQWSQTWQRPPNPSELDGLIRDYIKEEIYYREALRLGLDKDDMVVRRRMRSKMEFLATSETENMIATDLALETWLDKYPAKYALEPVYSLEQVYVSTTGSSDVSLVRAKSLLMQLQSGAKPSGLGDTISLPRSLDAVPATNISREFGEEFATALKTLPLGSWAGPVTSGFGLHLVRIHSVRAPHKPRLAEVRQEVENDWRAATRETRENQAYQALLDGYQIDIEKPE